MNIIGTDVHGVQEKSKANTYKPIVNNDQSNWLAGSSGSSTSSGSSSSSGRSGGSGGSGGGGSNGTYSNTSSTTTSSTTGGSESTTTSTTSAVGPVDPNTQAQRAKYSGDFKSRFESQLDDIYNKIMNREKFTYDMNSDVLYQQYRDQYVTQGRQAMEDTMGQAAAMTGGYGNSYAETAGQQAYQGYLQQLNDKVPELYNMAYERYKDEGDWMGRQYELTKGRYDDDWNQWQANRSFWNDEYWKERNAVMQTISNTLSRNWSNTVSNTTSNTVNGKL